MERDHKQMRVKGDVEEYLGLLITSWEYGRGDDL
jgi:hypothetical protein